MSNSKDEKKLSNIARRRYSRIIIIDIEGYEKLDMRSLNLNDLIFISKLMKQELDNRDFAEKVLHNQLVQPKFNIKDLRSIGDETLVRIAEQWIKEEWDIKQGGPERIVSLEQFHDVVVKYISQVDIEITEGTKALGLLLREAVRVSSDNVATTFSKAQQYMEALFKSDAYAAAINAALESALKGINESAERLAASFSIVSENMQQITSQIMRQVELAIPQVGELFSQLPDIAQQIRQWELAEEALTETGFEYTFHFLSGSFLAKLARVSPPLRKVVVSRNMLELTRSEVFTLKVENLFCKSSLLEPRKKIVMQALGAHRRREYYISIPVLIAQVEGIIGDIFILKDIAVRKGHKLYQRDINGQIKTDKKGEPIEISGLGTLVTRSKIREKEVFEFVVGQFVDNLVGERHAILHGRKTNYGKAKLSTQTILLLFVLANEIIYVETGDVEPFCE